jgi:DNA-binding MarR family transcriptional regulator
MYSSQWPVVLLLSERGPCTQVELTEQLAVEPPTMTRTLSRMEKAGWIRRVPGRDRRERRVELTEQSVRMVDEWKSQSRQLEQQALQDVSAEDYAAFDRVMKRIRSNLRVED